MDCQEHNVYQLLSYALLMCSILSLWVIPSSLVWGTLGVLSLGFAVYSGIASPALVLILFFGIFLLQALSWNIGNIVRFFVCILFALITLVVYSHLTPGIHNLLLVPANVVNQGCIPYALYWNFDKGIFGLIILGLYHPLIRSWSRCVEVLRATWPFLIITPIALLTGALLMGVVNPDTHLPPAFGLWLFAQIFFVVLPEEAFFRGFLQKQLSEALPQKFGDIIAVLLVAGVFSLMHLFYTTDARFLLLSFGAGVLYGTVYARTRSIEASFLVHFTVNLLHVLLLSYPHLQ